MLIWRASGVANASTCTEWSTTRSTGTSGCTSSGSRPSRETAARIAARSTSSGTPVKSWRSTRATKNGSSRVRSARGSQRARARTSSSVTRRPSRCRASDSSTMRSETGSRETGPNPRRSSSGNDTMVPGTPGEISKVAFAPSGSAIAFLRQRRYLRARPTAASGKGGVRDRPRATGARMTVPSQLYRPPLGLLTDFYELTMAYAAWKEGIQGREASFTVSFRRNPFDGGFTIAAGLADVVDLIASWRLGEEDLAFLSGLEAAPRGGPAGSPEGAEGVPGTTPEGVPGTAPRVFEPEFIEMLRDLAFELDVDAVPEGTVMFPHEPLLRVSGPVVPGMLLESAILAVVNFQSLVATKAARICLAAAGAPVIEFGMRRAQGIDGGLSAARAAFIGGCDGTSNTLAGRLYGIPIRGTHAHSWVMLHDSERDAFYAYARALPSNCVFLVDTYATLDGIAHAIDAARWLRTQGREIVGIRLDSGDLAWLSQQARKMLDAAGFPKAAILASNELDEHVVQSLRDQDAAIALWGVGTRLVTGHPDGALGGVYKLGAVRPVPGTPWKPRLKISEAIDKTSVPGIVQVRRFTKGADAFSDAIWEEGLGVPPRCVIVDPADPTRRREIPEGMAFEDLLVPIFRRGKRVYDPPPLESIRQRTKDQLGGFHAGVKRFLNPHRFPVGLEKQLHELRTRLVLEARRAPG